MPDIYDKGLRKLANVAHSDFQAWVSESLRRHSPATVHRSIGFCPWSSTWRSRTAGSPGNGQAETRKASTSVMVSA